MLTLIHTPVNHVKLGSTALEERIIVKHVPQAQMDKHRLQAVLRAPLGPCRVRVATVASSAIRESMLLLLRFHVKTVKAKGSMLMRESKPFASLLLPVKSPILTELGR